MTRGKQKLHQKLIKSSIPENIGVKSKRNADLERRADVMACRYYYHAEINRKRYDDCLMALYEEFFILPNTIVGFLLKKEDKIKELIQNKTTALELKRKYPWFNWS